MRLFVLGLILIFLGMFILAVGLPLVAWLCGGCKFAGFVWIFPFPVIAFGNVSHMSPILSILSILAFIVFIIFVVMFIISLVRYRKTEHDESELT